MRNIYTHQFTMQCPNNGEAIEYKLTICSLKMIMVEKIVLACAMWAEGYHEKMADNLFAQFGEVQILYAHHHGVDLVTRRGSRAWQMLRKLFGA